MKPASPSEIARETLKQLLARKMPPTPENYQAIYFEIADIKPSSTEPTAEIELLALLTALPKETTAQKKLQHQLSGALKNKNWPQHHKLLADFVGTHSAESGLGWGSLIVDLLKQWEFRQRNLTQARKRESLEHVLSAGNLNDEVLLKNLRGLVKSWSRHEIKADDGALFDDATQSSVLSENLNGEAIDQVKHQSSIGQTRESFYTLRELFALALESTLSSQFDDQAGLGTEVNTLAAALRCARPAQAMDDFRRPIKRLAFRLQLLTEDRQELQAGLLKLLQLMVENTGELVADDHWLSGQLSLVAEILARPLNLRAIHEAERKLKEIIFKQSQLKYSLAEAQQALQKMLASFVDHLADFARASSDYESKIGQCASKISQAGQLTQLEDVLSEVVSETRIVQLNAQRSHDELHSTRQQVEKAEQRIANLQAELDQSSQKLRHDQLTGALNRTALAENFAEAATRAQRRALPLCAALLDVDDFAKLTQKLGRNVGDAALIHLVGLMHEILRPQDSLARFNQEQFFILLPDVDIAEAENILIRLQRELTKRLFLLDNEKILMTFSAGLSAMQAGDSLLSISQRANEAMKKAQALGQNQVQIYA